MLFAAAALRLEIPEYPFCSSSVTILHSVFLFHIAVSLCSQAILWEDTVEEPKCFFWILDK